MLQGERCVYANTALKRISGYDDDEIAALHFIDAVHEADRDLVIKNNRRRIEGELFPAYEFRFLRKDGDIRWLSINAAKITWKNQPAVLCFVDDITLSKKARQAAKEYEERFRQFFETNAEYSYMISTDGAIMNINRSTLKALGYKKEELIGKPLLETIYAPGSRGRARRLFLQWHETGKIRNEEIVIITRKGTERTVILNIDAIRDIDGNIMHSISIQNDITERKETENEIRRVTAHFQNIFNSSPSGIFTVDARGHITSWSPACREIFGWSAEEVMGKFNPTVPPYETDFYFKSLHKKQTNLDVKALRKDGSPVDVLLSSTPQYDAHGNFAGALGVMTDITEQKKAEKRLAQSLHEKEILLKEIHHRVKNNLQVIASLLNLQSSKIKDKKILELYQQSKSRIYMIAAVHEKLYRTENFASINFQDYLKDVLNKVYRTSGIQNRVSLNLEAKNVILSINDAIPVGLIINGLFTNSIKYAFPEERQRVSLTSISISSTTKRIA